MSAWARDEMGIADSDTLYLLGLCQALIIITYMSDW